MEKSVLEWLDAAKDRFGDKTAYVDDTASVSFAEADEASRRIGTCIAKQFAPSQPVAVLMGRQVMTPPCFLGIVRAGCFYAPMDATMPEARLSQILSVTEAKLLITDRENLPKAEALGFEGTILLMEDMMKTEPDEELLCRAVSNLTGQAPLYIIFTSGSTGLPKGVATSHASLMCYIDGIQEVIGLDETDVIGNQAPLDYIAAIRDIYLPLLTGAKTVILPKSEFAQPVQLFETMNRYGVTTICWSTAGVELPARLDAFSAGKPEHLKRVVFSGAVISSACLRIWQQNLPEVTFINQYGPTEATGSCTYYIIPETVEDDTVIPIGVPYKHYSIFLLTEDGRSAGTDEEAEICIGGPALALGYYNAPELTDQYFVPHPENPQYRELVYKTGDLGRRDASDMLWFLGRKDRQIKHMGHRIELDEIEMTAQQIAGIRECCALYQKEKSLLYLFYSGEVTAKEIALYFRKKMPAFMVPRKIIAMDELPHLPNGKIARKQLEEKM